MFRCTSTAVVAVVTVEAVEALEAVDVVWWLWRLWSWGGFDFLSCVREPTQAFASWYFFSVTALLRLLAVAQVKLQKALV
jgi:hypothetical protein